MKDIVLLEWEINYTHVQVPLLTDEQIQWLDDHESDGHYARSGTGIYFEKQQDATVFALRWS
jgi:hypothetical protein